MQESESGPEEQVKRPVRVAPSYSTGGGGVTFERRVAVRYLAAMLTGAARTEAEGWRVVEVGFQQGPVGPIDDLHVRLVRAGDDEESLELWVAVRRHPEFVRSDTDTAKLIGTFVDALGAQTKPGVERRLVVAVAGQQTGASELAELAELARNMDESAFELEMAPDGRPRHALKNRFDHVCDLVADAVEPGEDPAATTWRLLRRMYVSMPRLETPDEMDWTALLTELEGWAREQSAAGADVLRAKLESLAAGYAPAAAVVRRAQVARDAHAALRLDRQMEAAAWAELRRIDSEARNGVRLVCGEGDVHVPRDAARNALGQALDGAALLIVCGDSGSGKSALVQSLVEHYEATEPEDFEAVVLDLRQLPRHPTELRSALGAPLERLFSEMHAPHRLLVIDGADIQAETDETPLGSVANAALEAGLAVCIVASTEGRAAVEGVASHLRVTMAHHTVAGLTDDEVDHLVRQVPMLERLAGVPQSRELLRRPAIADLLARAGGEDVPLSDSAAMDAIWTGLVRNHERTVRGAPDARDHVLRRLAADSLESGGLDLGQLDTAALDGLRRDGVLRPSELTWSPTPTFAHDILRTYAVARVLGEDDDPAERLKLYGSPRWALPAMRLVVEQRLRSDAGASRLTLQDAQQVFDDLAESGVGVRWADVPTEAALGLPEAGQLLEDSWDELADQAGNGLKRVLRIIDLRFRRAGFLDRLVAQNVAALLLRHGWPSDATAEVVEFIENWLLSLVIAPTPAGHTERVQLLELIDHHVADGDHRERQLAEERAQRLAARSEEEVAEAEARAAQFAKFSSIGFDDDGEDDDFDVPARDLPGELKHESTVRCLALLGPDMASRGEALLRRVADQDPSHLAPALESPLAAVGIAQFDSSLLVDLTDAYYINRRSRGYGLSHDHGIRSHVFVGGPMFGFHRGPFLTMLRADFVSGVGCLNRMLNHAVRARVKDRSGHEPAAETDGLSVELNLIGAPTPYIGDAQVWLWYRGTGMGPYPCMSGLQALEVVVDELIDDGRLSPDVIAQFLLKDCDNLAMPALVYGMLVRHLDHGTAALDPFLAEPAVWHLEFGRVTGEHSLLAARGAPVTAAERRNWDPWRVAMILTLSANEARADELRELGGRLKTRARELGWDATLGSSWGAALDRNAYDATETEEGVVVQQREDPEIAAALEEQRADYARFNGSLHLQARYVDRFDQIRRPDPLVLEELISDVAVARDLIDTIPVGDRMASEGPIATAAAALEGAYIDGLEVPLDDLLWGAQVLLDVVDERMRSTIDDVEDRQLYSHGADRSAARGLPLLLTPAAVGVREALADLGEGSIDTMLAWLFTMSPIEVRIFASRALDAVWAAPCDERPCHHTVALALVVESVRHASVRRSSWNPEDSRGPLSGPLTAALESAGERAVVAPDLSPALRALGEEARHDTCVRTEVSDLMPVLLATCRRSVKPFEHGYHQSESDALFAARATLTVAAQGDPTLLLEHAIDLAADAPHALEEYVEAIAAAAEERPDLADAARGVWPQLMRDVLGQLARSPQNPEDDQPDIVQSRSRVRRAFDRLRRPRRPVAPPVRRHSRDARWRTRAPNALLPHSTYEHRFRYSELMGEPIRWPEPQQWRPEIDMWIEASSGGREAIDAMVHMLQTQPIQEQASLGISWVERLVQVDPLSSRTFLLPEWLRNVRSYCSDEDLRAWQRIVDTLMVHGDTRVRDLAD